MRIIRSIALLLSLILFGACATKKFPLQKTQRYVVILSCDGFRADYLERGITPNIESLAKSGLKSQLIPCYPSLTFPNHYSMATGLYPQNHGLVHNRFYVDTLSYSLGDRNAVENPLFYSGTPLWNLATKQGLKSASYYWVGSETAVGGMQPSIWKKYDGSVSYRQRADSVLAWLQRPDAERPRLVMWYLDEPDHAGHFNGTQSEATDAAIMRVDSTIGYFVEKLKQLPIANRVDFIVVADHGMADYTPERSVNLIDYLPKEKFTHIVDGVPTSLYLADTTYTETAMQILAKVPHVKAYRKKDVPARFHYNNSDRIGDIIVMPEIGTFIQFRSSGARSRTGGAHGYDNLTKEMRALFVATGPDFKPGTTVEPFPNITLYPIVCRLLGLTPGHNDADEALAKEILAKSKRK